MLREAGSGLLLAVGDGGGLRRSTRGDDSAMWREDGPGVFTSVVRGGVVVRGAEEAAAPGALERRLRIRVAEGDEASFDAAFGPARLPSDHLAELRATGFSVLQGFSPKFTAALQDAIHAVSFVEVTDLDSPTGLVQLHVPMRGGHGIQELRDGRVVGSSLRFADIARCEARGLPHGGGCVELQLAGSATQRRYGLPTLAAAEELEARIRFGIDGGGKPPHNRRGYLHEESGHLFARLHTHPVMLWLLESWFGTPVRASHTPGAKIIMPQDGSLGPGQGWHSVRIYLLPLILPNYGPS